MTSSGFCPQCGKQRTGSLNYCGNCGFDFTQAANLGSQTVTQPTAAPTAPQTMGGRRWSGSNIALIAAGLALIAVPFLPFITATAALVGTITRSGAEIGGAETFLFCLFGALLVATGFQRSGGKRVGRALPIIAAICAGLLTAWYFTQINDRVNSVDSEFAIASIGIGLWLAVAASIVAFLVAIRDPQARWI